MSETDGPTDRHWVSAMDELWGRLLDAEAHPERYLDWQLEEMAADAAFHGEYAIEEAIWIALRRRQLERRRGRLAHPAPCPDALAASDMAWEGCPNQGVTP